MAISADLAALALLPSNEMARKWRCPRCQVDFPLDVAVCGGCGSSSRQPKAFLPPPKNAGTSAGLKMVAWRCRQCRHRNDIAEETCGECGAEKPPLPRSAAAKPEPPRAKFDVFSWSCPDCAVANSVLSEGCTQCGRAAPFLPEQKDKEEEEEEEKKKKKKKRKKLEAWNCRGCHSTQSVGHLRCSRCGHSSPRLPDAAALRQVKREVEKLRQLTEDLQLMTPDTEFECPVCLEITAPSSGCRLRSCGDNICKSCLSTLVSHSDGRPIACPLCPTGLDNRDARNAVASEVWERHVRLCLRRQAAARPFTFSCTVLDCSGRLQALPEASNCTARCSDCQKEHCLACRANHTGRTCEEYNQEERRRLSRDVTESHFEEMKRRGAAMDCPSCSAFLEKIYGCDWMKCPMCDTEVCWATKGPRWGPKGPGDITGGCRCRVNGVPCAPNCTTCHDLLPAGLK